MLFVKRYSAAHDGAVEHGVGCWVARAAYADNSANRATNTRIEEELTSAVLVCVT